MDALDSIRRYLELTPTLVRQQPVYHNYVWPAGVLEDPLGRSEPVEDLKSELLSIIDDDSQAFLLLLGGYGSGKTSFMYMLGLYLAENALKDFPNRPIPLYLNLGHAKGATNLVEAYSSFLARYDISLPADELRRFLLRSFNTVLLLDGFDEMASWIDYTQIPSQLAMIRDLQVADGTRIVLTGRTTFFRSKLEIGIVKATHVARLSPFDDGHIAQYLTARAPDISQDILDFLSKHPAIRRICCNPIHLMMLADAFSASISIAKTSDWESITISHLYTWFVERTLHDNFGDLHQWPLSQRLELVRKLAWRWLNEDIVEWQHREFSDFVRANLPDLREADVDKYTLQLLNCSFFSRVLDAFRFIHFSFIEFFVAETLVASLLRDDMTLWEARAFYTDIYEFIYQLILRGPGFSGIPINLVMSSGSRMAQANFLAMGYRHRPTEVEPHLRLAVLQNPHDLVRCLSMMGLGMYDPGDENVDCIATAFENESNSVIRAIAQRVASHWCNTKNGPIYQDKLADVIDIDVELRQEHAQRILLDEKSALGFQRAMLQGDSLWASSVGGILTLSILPHVPSFKFIHEIGSTAKNPEIRSAYELVLPMLVDCERDGDSSG